jgi:hypothetical protein
MRKFDFVIQFLYHQLLSNNVKHYLYFNFNNNYNAVIQYLNFLNNIW